MWERQIETDSVRMCKTETRETEGKRETEREREREKNREKEKPTGPKVSMSFSRHMK